MRPGTPDPGWSWLAPGKRRICPICLPADARIATPEGDVAASDVRAGMRVWTADARGARVPGVVLRVGSASAPRGHALVELTLADGRRVRASGGHPTAEGRPFDAIAVGDAIGGVRVVQVARIPYGGNATFDLLPSGETGTYWADGVLVGSTLR